MTKEAETKKLLEEELTPKEVASIQIEEWGKEDHGRERKYSQEELGELIESLEEEENQILNTWTWIYSTKIIYLRERAKSTIHRAEKGILALRLIEKRDSEYSGLINFIGRENPEETKEYVRLQLSYYKAYRRALVHFSQVIGTDILTDELRGLDRELEAMLVVLNREELKLNRMKPNQETLDNLSLSFKESLGEDWLDKDPDKVEIT